ncbi:MAG: hypothetical protein ACRYFW_02325, partial [Janthinobacterium lividum]
VPATFSLAVGVEEWIGPRLGRRLLTYRPGDDGTPVLEGPRGPVIEGARPDAIGYRGATPPQPAAE